MLGSDAAKHAERNVFCEHQISACKPNLHFLGLLFVILKAKLLKFGHLQWKNVRCSVNGSGKDEHHNLPFSNHRTLCIL